MIDPPVNAHKDGDYYDSCGSCGRETDATHRSEGSQAGAREIYHDWSIFNCNPTEGGCGYTWTRTTSTGAAKDRARGREPRALTRTSAGFVSVPTDAFRSNYEAAFGHP